MIAKLRFVGASLSFCMLLVATSGCISGGTTSILGRSHKLIQDAKVMRRQSPCPEALPTELNKTVLPEYRVAPGDVLLVETADFDSSVRLPADQTIMADGTIDLGKYGRPRVDGMTVEEIEAVVNKLVKTDEPINVRLVGPESKTFYVLGEVNAPGQYQLTGDETALSAILEAGGLTDQAAAEKIIMSRPTPNCSCRTVLPICYNQIVQLGDTGTNYQIMPGDRIYVPSRSIWESLFPFLQCDKPPCNRPQYGCPHNPACCDEGCAPAITYPIEEVSDVVELPSASE